MVFFSCRVERCTGARENTKKSHTVDSTRRQEWGKGRRWYSYRTPKKKTLWFNCFAHIQGAIYWSRVAIRRGISNQFRVTIRHIITCQWLTRLMFDFAICLGWLVTRIYDAPCLGTIFPRNTKISSRSWKEVHSRLSPGSVEEDLTDQANKECVESGFNRDLTKNERHPNKRKFAIEIARWTGRNP